jgi:GDPmannose 4,6-dehydratase
MSKLALVTGINGQLGSYLAELLLSKKYRVVGVYRRNANLNVENLSTVIDNENFELACGDITDASCVFGLLNKYKPDEIYNCAAQSFVHVSFTEPSHTFSVDTLGVLHFLEGIKQLKLDTKFITMSTSEMFGRAASYIDNFIGYPMRYETLDAKGMSTEHSLFQDESTQFCPQSPYGIAKLAGYHLVRLYREAYGIKCCSNINFNFESPRRGKEFVTRKITNHVGKLARWSGDTYTLSRFTSLPMESKTDTKFVRPLRCKESFLHLGNLDAKRDWGHAKDVAMACWLSLQQDNLRDYVVSTMETHTVREFCQKAFTHIGLDYEQYVAINQAYYRPAEVDYLLGDSSMIRTKLGWKPTVTFDELVEEMVYNDIKAGK